jgi:diguanylate cyclase
MADIMNIRKSPSMILIAPESQNAAGNSRTTPAAPDRAFERTIPYALTAIHQINALQAPADPPGFHLWYTYATQAFPGLNQTINEMLARDGKLSVDEIDRVYNRYLTPDFAAGRVEKVGESFKDKVEQIIALVDASIGCEAAYTENLSGVSGRLNAAKDRDSLREIVETLLKATRDVTTQNRALRESLESSKQEIMHLQEQLIVICREGLTDPLTSLANRKQFDQTLEQAIKLSQVKRRPLSLLMCDIDHFKRFNDTYGHVVGDQALRLIAAAISRAVRDQDTPARYGGEEFAVVLPNTSLDQAVATAEHLRGAIMDKKVVKRSTGEDLGRITVSIGVAQFQLADSAQSLIERADGYLYAAKRTGRNCVVWDTNGSSSNITSRDPREGGPQYAP